MFLGAKATLFSDFGRRTLRLMHMIVQNMFVRWEGIKMQFRDTLGYEREGIPATNVDPAVTHSLLVLAKATLERVGKTVSDGDPSLMAMMQIMKYLSKPKGSVFFCDGSAGNNANDGLTPLTPKLTLTATHALTAPLNDDTIVVLNYGGTGAASETFPILLSNSMIHVVGAQCMDNSKWPTIQSDDADLDAINITGARVELANLEVGGGANKAAIHVGSVAGIYGACIHDVWFGIADCAGLDGIRTDVGEDAPYLEVYDCRFGSRLTRYGIYNAGNATRGILGRQGHGNKFWNLADIAMNISGGVGLAEVIDNLFALSGDSVGRAITMGALSSGALISGNKASYRIDAMTNNPFRDLSNANHWIDNWRQGLTIAPDTV
jgi:hypothetical protein